MTPNPELADPERSTDENSIRERIKSRADEVVAALKTATDGFKELEELVSKLPADPEMDKSSADVRVAIVKSAQSLGSYSLTPLIVGVLYGPKKNRTTL